MERGDRRHAQRADEVEHVRSIIAAPDPVLMLDRYDVDTLVDGSCDVAVFALLVATDPVVYLEWIGRRLACGMERHDFTAPRCRREVMGERRDPALAWRVRGNECSPYDDGPPLGCAHR